MPRPCLICEHKKHNDIDNDLITGHSLGYIETKYKINKSSVHRHKKKHLSVDIVKKASNNILDKKKERKVSLASDNAWEKLEEMMLDLKGLQADAKKKSNTQGAIAAIREQSKIYEMIMKMMIAAKEAEDPYEKRYNNLFGEIQILYGIISSTLVGHPEIRNILIKEMDRRINDT